MIKRFLIAIIAGISITLFVIQEDPWVKNVIGNTFKRAFEASLDCTMECTVKNVRFFYPQLELANVTVTPKNGEPWQWKADSYCTKFTWLHLLMHGIIDMDVTMRGFKATSDVVNEQLAIGSYINKIVNAPALEIPTFLKAVVFKHGSFKIIDPEHNATLNFSWHSASKKINQILQTNFSFEDGSLCISDRICFKKLSGDVHIETQRAASGAMDAVVRGAGTAQLPQLPGSQKTCYISGDWKHNKGKIQVKHADHQLMINPVTLNTVNNKVIASLKATMPAQYVWQLARNKKDANIRGNATVHMLLNVTDMSKGVNGRLLFKDITYSSKPLCSFARLSFSRTRNTWKGGLDVACAPSGDIHGSWQWDMRTNTGSAHITNESEFVVPFTRYWYIRAHDAQVQLVADAKKQIAGAYQAVTTNSKAHTSHTVVGNLAITERAVGLQGTYDANQYEFEMQHSPEIQLQKAELYNDSGNPFVTIQKTNENSFTGAIQYAFFKSMVHNWFGYHLQGTGILQLQGNYNTHAVDMNVALINGTIRLPETYNFINKFSCNIHADYQSKTVCVQNMNCGLHKGTVSIGHARMVFNDAGELSFVHAPITFEHCLCNVQKDLFTQVSGSCLFTKQVADESANLQGHIFLERGQLVENMLFDRFIAKVSSRTGSLLPSNVPKMNLDLTVETKEPMRIKTAFLETDATINVALGNTLADPRIAGSILFNTGKLLFPYRPLYITKGRIQLQPHKLFDPHIELIAQNTIKSHAITLQATGSLQQRHVRLHSVPHVSEEQIVSLLLVGSQEESLNVVMPALVVNNIGSLLFSSQKSSLNVKNSLGKLFRPLQHVRLVPHFTDQTGRGGLRGALEIELSDRWRAVIQKNFSLSEDTRFELSYEVSDDMSVRAYRDERRDVAAEVEMRWKW